MTKFLAWWRTLTPGQQVLTVIVAIIVAVIIRNIARNYFTTLDAAVKNTTEAKALEQAGQTLTFAPGDYTKYADKLYAAMDGPGTYTSEVFDIFANFQNDRDILELEKAFGLRLSSWSSSWFTDPTDLQDWLIGDLSADAISQLNEQLKRQGVTKQF